MTESKLERYVRPYPSTSARNLPIRASDTGASPQRDPMPTFHIASSNCLLTDLVRALLCEHYPHASVTCSTSGASDTRGVEVSLEGSGRWLFLSAAGGPDRSMAEALAAGACAVLSIGSDRYAVARALASLVDGAPPYVPVTLIHWMAAQVLVNTAAPDESAAGRLTSRERSVLALVARGCSTAEIGNQLTISENTVRTHLHALFVKLGGSSRSKMLANARMLRIPEACGRPGYTRRAHARATA